MADEEVVNEPSSDPVEEENNVLELSDAEFNELPIPDDDDPVEEINEEQEPEEPTPDSVIEEETQDAFKDAPSGDTTVPDEQTESKPDLEQSTEDTDEDSSKTEVDYEKEYASAIAPLKANGKLHDISSIEELRKLASMGANYTKKMVALKPNLKLMKMLENNGLLDEQKLSYLIDLDQKNPDAIQKFIKESGIDPLEIDVEKDTEYQPKTYTVNDAQLQLDEVLDNIRGTPSFDKTIDIIGNKWDESSKQILLDNPTIITSINEHVESGIYDTINTHIEKERMLGNLVGLSDLDAYKKIGDTLQAQGAFNAPGNTEEPITPSNKPADDPKLKEKKRAASPTKRPASKSKAKEDFNPLALSDAEFEKLTAGQLL